MRRGMLLLLLAAVSYGSLAVLIKGAVQAGVNAETVLTLRFTVAPPIWWAVILARRSPSRIPVRPALLAAAIGMLLYAPNAFIYYQGTARVPGAIAAMAVALVPVMVAVLSRLLLQERLGALGRIALVLVVIGGILLAGGSRGRLDPLGVLLLVVAVGLYSLYIVVSVRATRVLTPLVATACVTTGAGVLSLVWSGLSGRLDLGFAPAGWAAVAGLILLPTLLGMFAFLAGAEIVGAARAAIVTALEPLAGVLLAVLFLGDRLDTLQFVGGGLLIIAALLVQEERRRLERRGT